MSAADLANDQDRELTVVTAERDDLQLRLDEAEAVIDAVRKVRDDCRELHEAAATAKGQVDAPSLFLGMEIAAGYTRRHLDLVDGL